VPATDDVLEAATAVRDRYAAALAKEEADIAGMLASAVATKTSLPDHYWQRQHTLRSRLQTADMVVEVLRELR
jgi:hypothetical protein